MCKQKRTTGMKMSNFPEEVTTDGILIYGETSYENSIAVLSHYLHNHNGEASEEQKAKIITAVREFLHRKQFRQGLNEELSDDEVWHVAEDAAQYNLFADFFNVLKTFLHLSENCFYSLFEDILQISIFVFLDRNRLTIIITLNNLAAQSPKFFHLLLLLRTLDQASKIQFFCKRNDMTNYG